MNTVFRTVLAASACAALCLSTNVAVPRETVAELFEPVDVSVGDSPEAEAWIEAQLASMSLEERVGQLFVARVHSDGSAGTLAAAEQLVREHHLGGLCFFSGTPDAQVAWTNQLQAASAKTPLLVAMDAEWGAAMRFGNKIRRRPYAMTIGAANDAGLAREIGRESGRELRRLGVHMSFAPVADLNSNAANPVIGRRSFGEQATRVGALAMAYARGLAEGGVLAVAKHFPGHGDTQVDSHHDLPVVQRTLAQLEALEFVPFQMLAQDRIAGIMTGHLSVPAVDARANRPASLSAALAEEVLRKRWNYDGLVITDGLDMAGITKHFSAAQASVEAFAAGNDLLLIPKDIPAGIAALTKAVRDGKIAADRLDASVRRILRAKYTVGLADYAPTVETGVVDEVNVSRIDDLSERLYRAAVTVARNRTQALPIVAVDSIHTAVVSLGQGTISEFQRAASRYAPVDVLQWPQSASAADLQRLETRLGEYDLVLVGLHGLSGDVKKGYGLSAEQLKQLERLRTRTRVVVAIFGSPYLLPKFDAFDNVVVGYEDTPLAQKAVAEAIYGATPLTGTLPVSAGSAWPAGEGHQSGSLARLLYSQPGNAGFRESQLQQIDAIMRDGIRVHATPGGVVLAARQGQVGYLRAYGNYTYEPGAAPVDAGTVYDLASVTKVAATTLCVMRLYERGQFSVYDTLGQHLPWLRGTNKGGLTIYDVLAHQARLKAWIPFFEQTVTNEGGVKHHVAGVYTSSSQANFSTPITDKMFIANAWRDSIYRQIAESPLLPGRGYTYSDLGFYIMAELVLQKTGMSVDQFAEREFYRPLGLTTIGYRPLSHMDVQRVAPSENDTYWRFGRVQGYVHDMGAAMLGGVSGHAGLFSNVTDLAVIGQLLLNDGYYGGRRYFKPETIALFTTRHAKSTRRGLGWDMAELSSRGANNMSELASSQTFGHLGFTGTCMWADPETGVLFVFLTNRTYPSMSQNKFNKDRYRPRMQSAVYESLVE